MAKINKKAVDIEVVVTRAFQFKDGNVVFDCEANGIKLYGLSIIEGKNGDFISFPSKKGKDGKYYSHCYFESTQELVDDVVDQINKML